MRFEPGLPGPNFFCKISKNEIINLLPVFFPTISDNLQQSNSMYLCSEFQRGVYGIGGVGEP